MTDGRFGHVTEYRSSRRCAFCPYGRAICLQFGQSPRDNLTFQQRMYTAIYSQMEAGLPRHAKVP
eukprot:7069711-Prymnesium_polylepis.1